MGNWKSAEILRALEGSVGCECPSRCFYPAIRPSEKTWLTAPRYKVGESIEELAKDYGRSRSDIEEAIRCELWLDAA